MKYRFMEHTADTKFQAFGKTLEESFSNAAIAMFEVLLETKKVEKKLTKKIKLESHDKENLLYKWLEDQLKNSKAKFIFFFNHTLSLCVLCLLCFCGNLKNICTFK